jgi:hypothetical protein
MLKQLAAFVLALAWVSTPGRAADSPKTAEPGPWKLAWVAGLNLSQSSFSDNWAGGDQGSIVWVLNSDTQAERQFSAWYDLSNHLQLAYGQAVQQQPDPADPGRLVWATPRKSNDLILFESVSRFTLGGWVDPYAALRLDSQFQDASSPLGTVTLSPIKLAESAGIAKALQKTDERELITRLGFGFREILARQFDPATGAKVRVSTNDGGFEWQTSATQPILDKKVLYQGQLRVFQPVFFSRSGALEQFDRDAQAFDPGREAVAVFWKSPTVDFRSAFTAQITKIIAVNLAVQWTYLKFDPATDVDNTKPIADRIRAVDRGVRKGGQFREALAIGLTYSLF